VGRRCIKQWGGILEKKKKLEGRPDGMHHQKSDYTVLAGERILAPLRGQGENTKTKQTSKGEIGDASMGG